MDDDDDDDDDISNSYKLYAVHTQHYKLLWEDPALHERTSFLPQA